MVRVAIRYLNAGLRAISFELAHLHIDLAREADLTSDRVRGVSINASWFEFEARAPKDDDIDLLYLRRHILVHQFGWFATSLIPLLCS